MSATRCIPNLITISLRPRRLPIVPDNPERYSESEQNQCSQ